MTNDILVDIVIPLYNEEKVLEKSTETLLDFIRTSNFPYKYVITLANNASTDGSWKICTELATKHPTVMALDVGKKGKGLAVRKAWEKSAGNILVFTDTDLSVDLHSLRPLVDTIFIGGYHMAIASRLGPMSQVTSNKRIRKIASRVYNFVVRLMLRSTIADHQCGFKAMRKDAFMSVSPYLNEDGFSFDTELIALSIRQGMKIKSIDIICNDNTDSKVSLFGDSIKMFANVVHLRKRLLRMKFNTFDASA